MKIRMKDGKLVDLVEYRKDLEGEIESWGMGNHTAVNAVPILDALEAALSVEPGAGVGWTWDDAIRNVRQAAGLVEE